MTKPLKYLGVAFIWLLVWQLASLLVANDILLCSPLEVVRVLIHGSVTFRFWTTILYSLLRIGAGFSLAFVFGALLGALAWRSKVFAAFFDPLVLCMKSVPIVCFIVLLLIWSGPSLISASAVFLVTFPAIYFAVAEGLRSQDTRLLEMLQVFGVPFRRRLLAFYWPTILPFLISACRVAVGMAWKAGVAAELIGLPLGSIGERIYQSKILLSSADLFAWTLVVAVAALVCEKLFLRVLRASENAAWHLALPRSQKARRCAVDTEGDAGNGAGNGAGGLEDGAGLKDGAGNGTRRVLISGLNKTFGKGREAHTVITSFSAILQPKGRYVLNSPSGGGKTTLLRIIAGLCLPDSGTICGAEHLAMVFQEARLFEGRSAVDNLRLVVGRACSDSDIRRLLSTVLSPEVLDQPVAELSGGMRRRVELCRALAADSQLLLLDEPFAGLDEISHAAALSFVLSELRGRILLLATHDSKDVQELNAEVLTLTLTP